jgi:hypothetical protein
MRQRRNHIEHDNREEVRVCTAVEHRREDLPGQRLGRSAVPLRDRERKPELPPELAIRAVCVGRLFAASKRALGLVQPSELGQRKALPNQSKWPIGLNLQRPVDHRKRLCRTPEPAQTQSGVAGCT